MEYTKTNGGQYVPQPGLRRHVPTHEPSRYQLIPQPWSHHVPIPSQQHSCIPTDTSHSNYVPAAAAFEPTASRCQTLTASEVRSDERVYARQTRVGTLDDLFAVGDLQFTEHLAPVSPTEQSHGAYHHEPPYERLDAPIPFVSTHALLDSRADFEGRLVPSVSQASHTSLYADGSMHDRTSLNGGPQPEMRSVYLGASVQPHPASSVSSTNHIAVPSNLNLSRDTPPVVDSSMPVHAQIQLPYEHAYFNSASLHASTQPNMLPPHVLSASDNLPAPMDVPVVVPSHSRQLIGYDTVHATTSSLQATMPPAPLVLPTSQPLFAPSAITSPSPPSAEPEHDSPHSPLESSPPVATSRKLPTMHRCSLCHKSFDRPSTLKVHKRVHTLEKNYQCERCDRKFSVPSNLKRHVKTCGVTKTSDPKSPTEHSGESRPKRPRRKNVAAPWRPASLEGFTIGSNDKVPLPLPPVLPADVDPATAAFNLQHAQQEFDPFPYSDRAWRGVFPGPALKPLTYRMESVS